MAHDTLDRLADITAPTLVLAGELDLATPPRMGRVVADGIPDATVSTELAFQNAQRAKREAADALRGGDPEAASRLYGGAGEALRAFASVAPADMADDLAEEASLLSDLSARASSDDPSRIAKFSEAERHLKERKRGRGRPPIGR